MKSSLQWRDHFEQNNASLLEIPWELGEELSEAERKAVTASLQGFQAGESSEGKHLFHYAKEYAEQSGDHDYPEAIRVFIGEEQRHARDLAKFLSLNNIPLKKTTFSDRVFRKLRNLWGGLEVSVAVLTTAEVISKVYYPALQNATESQILQRLCEQIIQDEEQHVQFQAEQLGKLRQTRSRLMMAATMGLQRFLFFGTVFVVWGGHRKVFRRGGLNFRRYWRACWQEFRQAFAIVEEIRRELKQTTEFGRQK